MGDGLTYPLKAAKSKKPVHGISLPPGSQPFLKFHQVLRLLPFAPKGVWRTRANPAMAQRTH